MGQKGDPTMIHTDSGLKVFEAAREWQPSFPMVLDRIAGTWLVVGWTTDNDDEEGGR